MSAAWERLAARRSEPLYPFVVEAMKAPRLRALFPYISLHELTFSRVTGYPLTTDCPRISADSKTGTFKVLSPTLGPVGEGSAAEAVQLACRDLPESASEAVLRTDEV